MSIEYLIYTQNYLECLTRALDLHYKTAYEQCKTYKSELHEKGVEIKKLSKERDRLQTTVDSLKNLKEMPKDGDHTKAVTCRHCHRTFASDHFLRKHYGRRHPEKDFDKEYPTQTDVLKLQDNTQQEMAEQQKKETAQFVQNLKKELIESLGGSLGQLEREIGQIKGE